MKYVAKRTLAHQDSISSVTEEKQVPGTDRIGDVVAEFSDSGVPHGHGVVCEVQHKHDEKDIERVTGEYLDVGYSVYWLYEHHYLDDFRHVQLPPPVPVWPHAVPMASFWPGAEMPWIEVSTMEPGKPIMDVKLPPDALKDNEGIQQAFERGRLQADAGMDFDVFRQLGEYSSDRSCAECGDPADFYLLRFNVISEYRCLKHTKSLADNSITR